jgi:hypothetical protein
MTRVKLFFRARAEIWDQQVTGSSPWTNLDCMVRGGMEAYAREQAAQFRAMLDYCEDAWRLVDGYMRKLGQQEVVPAEMDSKVADENQ